MNESVLLLRFNHERRIIIGDLFFLLAIRTKALLAVHWSEGCAPTELVRV
jgi:hypothetical protein